MDKKQKEVWDVVQIYTDLIMHGKVDEFLEYFHEEYSGWSNVEPIPSDKESLVSELRRRSPLQVIEQYDIIPIKIKIHDKIAIVHYFLRKRFKDKERNKKTIVKHYTDILVNNYDRWFLIADHFGVQESKKIKNKKEG